MAKDTLRTRLQLEGGDKVERDWRKVGAEAETALQRIMRASEEGRRKTERLTGSVREFGQAARLAGGDAKALDKGLKTGTDRMQSFRAALMQTTALVGVGFGINEIVDTFSRFDAGLTGVAKTTGLAGEELAALGRDIQGLSREIPVAADAMLGIAEAAGQLGVMGRDNLVLFTGTLARLQLTSDVVGEDGAKALARMLEVTGESIGAVDRLGSAISALGANYAASEGEIVKHATNVAQGTALYDVGAANATGLGAALASLGVTAELARSSTGRAFAAINESIQAGGRAAETLSELTGIARNDLAAAFRDDATSVFQSFVEGLGEVNARGGDVAGVLQQLGLTGTENLSVLGTLAQNAGVLGEALTAANTAWQENTALTEEALRASQSFSAQMQLVRNAVDEAAVEIGRELAPLIADVTGDFADWVKEAKDSGQLRAMFETMRPPLEGLAKAAALLAENFDLVVAAGAAYASLRLAQKFGSVGKAALDNAKAQVEAIKSIKARTEAQKADTAAALARARAEEKAAASDLKASAAAMANGRALGSSTTAALAAREAFVRLEVAKARERAASVSLTMAEKAHAAALRGTTRAARGAAVALRAMNIAGGPWTIAAIAVSFAIEAMFMANMEATEAENMHSEAMARSLELMEELKAASGDRADALRREQAELMEKTKADLAALEQRRKEAQEKADKAAAAAWIAAPAAVPVLLYQNNEVEDLTAQIEKLRGELAEMEKQAVRAGDATVEGAAAADLAAGAQQRLREAMEATVKQLDDVGKAAGDVARKIDTAAKREEKALDDSLKAIADAHKAVRKEIDANLEARLAAIDTEAEAETKALVSLDDERERARRSVEIVEQAATDKTEAIEGWARNAFRETQAYYDRVMTLERQAGRDTTDLAREAAADRAAIWREMEDGYAALVDSLVAEEQRHVDAARKATEEISADREAMERRIRDLRRSTMDEDDQRDDREAERLERLAQAEQALEEGRYADAKRLAEEAADLAEANAEAVDGSQRQRRRAVEAAVAQMEEAAALVEAANQGLAEAEGAAAEVTRAQVEAARERLTVVRSELAGLEAAIAATAGREIVIETAQAEAAIKRLVLLLEDLRQAEAVSTAVTRLGKAIEGLRENAASEPLRLEARLQAETVAGDLEGLVKLAEHYDVTLPATLSTVQAQSALTDLVARVGEVGQTIEALPPVEVTVDEPSASAAERRIDEIARDRTVRIRVADGGGEGAADQAPVRRAGGGPVHGPGGPTDDRVPAMLSDGEFVTRASAVDAVGLSFMRRLNSVDSRAAFLDLIRSMRVPGFATGGLVTAGAFGGADRPVATLPDIPALPDLATLTGGQRGGGGQTLHLYLGQDAAPVTVSADSAAAEAILRSGLFRTTPPRRR